MGTAESITICKRKLLWHFAEPACVLFLFAAYFLHLVQSGIAHGDSPADFVIASTIFLAPLALLIWVRHQDETYALLWRTLSIVTLLRPRSGLHISDTGIIDHSTVTACGEIPWDWVTNIELIQEDGVTGIAVHLALDHVETLISGQRGIKSKLLILNTRTFGSPIILTEATLNVSNGELYDKLIQHYQPVSERRHLSDAPREEYLAPYIERPLKVEP